MKKIACLLPLLLILSCVNNAFESFSDDDSFTFYPVEWFGYTNEQSTPKLALFISTSKSYPCGGYRIKHISNANGREFNIQLMGITKPTACATIFAPAGAIIEIPEYTKQLSISHNENIDRYKININSERINVEKINAHFTESLFKVTGRYPKNTFSFMCVVTPTSESQCTDIRNLISAASGIESYTFQENVRNPYLPVWAESLEAPYNNRYDFFKYGNEEQLISLQQQLKDFYIENSLSEAHIAFSIKSWNNRVISQNDFK